MRIGCSPHFSACDAAGLRRVLVELPRDKKRLGARGSAWPCVSATAAAARHRTSAMFYHGWGLVRACLSILELCEWFRDSSQASGASQRVQRASDALPLIGRCAGWPCTPWPFARPQPECRFASMSSVTRLVARVHSLACAVTVRLGVASSLLRCAPRVASGCYAGRSGLSVRRSGALRFLRGASDSGGARAMIYHGARATPTLFTLRTHVLQPARSGACGPASLSWISMVARAGSSLGRWRCGSCVSVRLIALGFARLGRLPG